MLLWPDTRKGCRCKHDKKKKHFIAHLTGTGLHAQSGSRVLRCLGAWNVTCGGTRAEQKHARRREFRSPATKTKERKRRRERRKHFGAVKQPLKSVARGSHDALAYPEEFRVATTAKGMKPPPRLYTVNGSARSRLIGIPKPVLSPRKPSRHLL